MGLYLCVFDGDEELDGVEVGRYADFARFRDAVCERLEGGAWASRFPVLMAHSDCDGEWSAEEARLLERELQSVSEEMGRLPPVPLSEGWMSEVARAAGLRQTHLRDCFFDVDGEPLIERLVALCRLASARGLPILFQ